MPISEDQCDDFSERTATMVRRAVLPIMRAAMNREAQARAAAHPGEGMVPWDLSAGVMAGVIGAAVEVMWSLCPPDAKKEDPQLPAMFAAMAGTYLEDISYPPGELISRIEKNDQDIRAKRRKMT